MNDETLSFAAEGIMPNGDAGGLSIVQKEKLDDQLTEYLDLLTRQHPFHMDMKVDNRRVIKQLSEIWPEMPKWHEQAHMIWERIDEVVQSIPAIAVTPETVIRMSADALPLAPAALPQHDAHAAFASFDTARGTLSHYVMPVAEELPSLEELSVASGLTLVCQPVPWLINKYGDNRGTGLGAAHIYNEARKDAPKVVPHETPVVDRPVHAVVPALTL